MSRQAIDNANAGFAAAMNQGNVAAAMRVYADDAKLLPPNNPAVTGKAISRLSGKVLDKHWCAGRFAHPFGISA